MLSLSGIAAVIGVVRRLLAAHQGIDPPTAGPPPILNSVQNATFILGSRHSHLPDCTEQIWHSFARIRNDVNDGLYPIPLKKSVFEYSDGDGSAPRR